MGLRIIRAQCHGPLDEAARLVLPPEHCQHAGAVIVGGGVVRIDREAPLDRGPGPVDGALLTRTVAERLVLLDRQGDRQVVVGL